MLKIKELRNKQNESQTALANKIGVSLRTVQNYESGDVDVPFKKLELIAKYYDVSVSYLFSEETSDAPYKRVYPNFRSIPLVTQYAYAGYLGGFGDHEYVEQLPTVPFPLEASEKGNFLAFEVRGDSMNDCTMDAIMEGDVLLGQEVTSDKWQDKFPTKHWGWILVHKTEGLLIKQISKHDTDTGVLTLHSLNSFYDDLNVNIDDIGQIFKAFSFSRKPR